jgi:dienelactone hydrolase
MASELEVVQAIISELTRSDFAAVERRISERLKQLAPPGALESAWHGTEQQAGAFQRLGDVRAVQLQGSVTYVATCVFERASLDVNIKLDGEGKVAGLTITPVGSVERVANATYDAPPYARPDLFIEDEIVVSQGEWTLPGTLSLPRAGAPFAAVTLVHGSGPQDRDETIPPNKPFRDLAWGLASQGIAVLRYEKRTKVYGARAKADIATLTVKDETIDDALAALALLRDRTEIDPRRLFVVGHSLGGYLAPRIAAADPAIRGLVILAGSARPLEDILLDQMTYIFSLTVTDPTARERQLEALRQQVALVKDTEHLPKAAASELPYGVPAAYWMDLNAYNPGAVAQTLTQEMLFLQGLSDYQVTVQDFQIWRDALAGHDNAQFIEYPGLSHIFAPVEGGKMATPETYSVPGHMAETVVNDIATWIKRWV